MIRFFKLLGLMVWLAGCTSATTTDASVCPYTAPVVKNPAGGLHGYPCTQDSECKYGTCVFGALQQGGVKGAVGVCTKQCACGAGSSCSSDNVEGEEFACLFADGGPGKECGLYCSSAADCLKINPQLQYCVAGVEGKFQVGRKVCSAVNQ